MHHWLGDDTGDVKEGHFIRWRQYFREAMLSEASLRESMRIL